MRNESLVVWRRRWVLWTIPLAFLVINIALVFAHRLVLTVRVSVLEQNLEASEVELEKARAERQELEDRWRRGDVTNQHLENLYQTRLAGEETRLTELLAAVREMARQSGLEPTSFSYPEVDFEEFGLRKMSFVFGSVGGSYENLWELITRLETSEHFLTLEGIAVSGGDQAGALTIQLTLSTLFAVDEGEEAGDTA